MPAGTIEEQISKLSLPELRELLTRLVEEIELRAMELIEE